MLYFRTNKNIYRSFLGVVRKRRKESGATLYLHSYLNISNLPIFCKPISTPSNLGGSVANFSLECFLTCCVGGTLLEKMLKRTAQFTPADAAPSSQVVQKLPIPKRTRLLVEQVARERENAIGKRLRIGFQRFFLLLFAK